MFFRNLMYLIFASVISIVSTAPMRTSAEEVLIDKKGLEKKLVFFDNNPSLETRVIYVDDDNTTGPWDGSFEHPYRYIRSGINDASNGDEVVVFEGIYKESVKFYGKNIILRSTNSTNPSVVENTIISGRDNSTYPVVTFSGDETSSCVLSGFTIENRHSSHLVNGVISGMGTMATIKNNIINNYFSFFPYNKCRGLDNCDGTIQDNTITNWSLDGLFNCDGLIIGNTISGNLGSGLAYCNGVIKNNIITNNSGYPGSGLRHCDGTIEKNIISNNSNIFESGGGLFYCNGVIKNNIITNNFAIWGGGLDRCDGTIQDNIITSNLADANGGGLLGCGGTIQGNTITDNSAYNGGGLYGCNGFIIRNIISGNSSLAPKGYYNGGGGLSDCEGIIQDNTITGNSANSWGGGLNYWDHPNCGAIVQNNIISDNLAFKGGGIAWYSGCEAGIIRNNTIVNNSATERGGGLYYFTGINVNNIIWGNSAPEGAQLDDSCSTPSYCCIQDWVGNGEGNISKNPRFIDPVNGDFHLKDGSPCIDSGSYIDGLNQDLEGNKRPLDGDRLGSGNTGDGSDYDIGAYEYIAPIPTAVKYGRWARYF